MQELLKRYWWVAAIAAVLLVINAGSAVATSRLKADPGAQEYASGALCWCLAENAGGPVVNPTPGPSGGECDNCGGRGKVGDGTIMKTCPVCNGTGRRNPIPDDGDDGDIGDAGEKSPKPVATTPPDVSDADDCEDGSCAASGGEYRVRRGIFGGFFRRR